MWHGFRQRGRRLESSFLGQRIFRHRQRVATSHRVLAYQSPSLRRKLTIEAMFVNSLSAVTATDCTRNLSLHLASRGGSCFIAWRRTVKNLLVPQLLLEYLETALTRNFNFFSWFDSARVWSDTVSKYLSKHYKSCP